MQLAHILTSNRRYLYSNEKGTSNQSMSKAYSHRQLDIGIVLLEL
jgi:hypothetical protein